MSISLDPPGSPPTGPSTPSSECAREPPGPGDGGELFEVDLRLAGRPVRLRVTGRALADTLLRTWAHLRVLLEGAGPPVLHLDFLDGKRTEPAPHVTATRLGEVSPDRRFLALRRWESLTALDRTAGRMITFVPHETRVTQQERGRPLFEALTVWLQDRGVLPVHAGLVAHGGRGLLCGGPGAPGSGASASAASRRASSFSAKTRWASSRRPRASAATASSGRSSWPPNALARFPRPGAAQEPVDPGEEKGMVMLTDLISTTLRRDVPIHAIILPRVTGAPTSTLRPASAGDALRRLAPSTLLRRHDVQAGLDRSSELTGSALAFWLDLGDRPERVPDRLASLDL